MSTQPEIQITRSPDFRVVYSSGVFGGLNPVDARMIFYVDRPMPVPDPDTYGQMKTGSVEREMQVEVHMSPQEFISTYHWMRNHIERLEKAGVLVKKETSQ